MGRDPNERRRGPKRKRATRRYSFEEYEDTEWLLGLIIGTALVGGAVRVGLTRDGGALAVGMYLGEDRETEYITPNEDLGEAVREIALAWQVPIATYDDEAGQWVVPPEAQKGA